MTLDSYSTGISTDTPVNRNGWSVVNE